MRLVHWLLGVLFPPKCVLCGKVLGKEALDLCRTCRDFPRWEVLLCDRVEQGLSLACPEAARQLLARTAPLRFVRQAEGAGEIVVAPSFDPECLVGGGVKDCFGHCGGVLTE